MDEMMKKRMGAHFIVLPFSFESALCINKYNKPSEDGKKKKNFAVVSGALMGATSSCFLMSLLQFPLIIAFDKVEFSFALLAAECWQHDGLVIMFTFRSNESQCILDKIDDDEQKAVK